MKESLEKKTRFISQIPSREELLAKLLAHSFLNQWICGRRKSGDFRIRSSSMRTKQKAFRKRIIFSLYSPHVDEKLFNSPILHKVLDAQWKTSVLELADLVKAMEEKFGVSCFAPVVGFVASPAAGGGREGGGEGRVVEKTPSDVILANAGGQKIAVIKVVVKLLDLA